MIADRFWELLSKKVFAEANEAELKEFEELLLHRNDWKITSEILTHLAHQSKPIEKNNESEQAFEKHIEKIKKLDIDFTGLDREDQQMTIEEERSSKFRK